MAENRYISFIENIIQQTKDKQLIWKYLDSNKRLYEGMQWMKTETEFGLFAPREKTYPDFNQEDSFYTEIAGTYIVLYVWGHDPADLYVVPSTYKKVVHLGANEYGEHITRLLNLVQVQFPDGEKFIDDLLDKQREINNS